MNPTLLLAFAIVFVAFVAGIFFFFPRRWRRGAAPAAAPAAAAPPPPWYNRLRSGSTWLSAVVAALILLIGLVGLLALPALRGVFTPAAERFVVLVAPFDDGGDGGTGRNVAASLARAIEERSGGAIDARTTLSRPATPQEALDMAVAADADLLIWGAVEPGAMLDSPSLSPQLIYTPTGVYAPNGWDGYLGRFAMPRAYPLTSAPVNGQAVVLPFVLALYDYASGSPDLAFAQLGALLDNYPSLYPTLPRALRGNVLWARTFYPEAVAEYQLALAGPSAEQALLANNLAAIRLDAADPELLSSFQEALNLLEGRDLGELRYNLAVLALREGRNADAVTAMEQARNLLPPSAPLLLDLTSAYRETGQLGKAAATLSAAVEQAAGDLRRTPADYRPMLDDRYDAAITEQQALLDYARKLSAMGPLLWELEVAAPLPADQLTDLRDRLQRAVDAADAQVSSWRKRATSDGAVRPDSGLVATGQAERAELSADRQRFYLAVLKTDLARVQGARPPSFWEALFSTEAQVADQFGLLETLQRRHPEHAQFSNALGRARRLSGDLGGAEAAFALNRELASQAPEGYFGAGAVARARGERQLAAERYSLALQRQPAFFPAHYELAAMDEEVGDFAGAVAERRAIRELRPGPASTIALARTLRLSGPQGFAEAKLILEELRQGNPDAAIEYARLANDASQPEVAVDAYLNALELAPGQATAAFELGETYLALERFQDAERSLRRAVRAAPANVAAHLALAELYQGPLNARERAEAEYRQALEIGIDDVAVLEQIGDVALAARNFGQAVAAFGDAVDLDPSSASFRYKLARARFEAGQPLLAGEQADAALPLAGDPALQSAILTLQGDIARLRGDEAGAAGVYAQALQLNPGALRAELGLGLLAVAEGNWGVATGYFRSAAAMPGGFDDPQAQLWLGEALLRQNSLAPATAAYSRALELQQKFPEAYLGLAQVQYALGGPRARETALETVERALAQRDDYAEALLFKGKRLQELGRVAAAEEAYSAAIRANRRIAESYYYRGMLAIQDERYDEALRDFRQALTIQPNFPDASYWLGRAYYAQGRADLAFQSFEQAVKLNGTFGEALFYIGLVAEDLGRTTDAISAYQTVINLDPTSELAGRARAQIARLM